MKEGLVLRLADLEHVLSDKTRGETFTIYVRNALDFCSGDFIGLLGPSGCGKTTLLTILGLLRKPTNLDSLGAFELYQKDHACGGVTRIDLKAAWNNDRHSLVEQIRRTHMGFALQSGELISSLTVTENICVPLRLNHWGNNEIKQRSSELLEAFELNRIKSDEKNTLNPKSLVPAKRNAKQNAIAASRINRLSGGEYQRVCLARAIAHFPRVVFVDEPTSALNRELANGALAVMQKVQHEAKNPGITFMITHDETLAERFCNVIVRMAPRKNEAAGEVVEITRRDTPIGTSEN